MGEGGRRPALKATGLWAARQARCSRFRALESGACAYRSVPGADEDQSELLARKPPGRLLVRTALRVRPLPLLRRCRGAGNDGRDSVGHCLLEGRAQLLVGNHAREEQHLLLLMAPHGKHQGVLW